MIFLGSQTHRGGPSAWGFPAARWSEPARLFDPAEGAATTGRAGRIRYATSKLACILLAYGLERREGRAGIHAMAFDPGLMPQTGLARHYPASVQRAYAALAPVIVRLPEASPVAVSAADLAWLATDDDARHLAGRYVSGRRARPSSLQSSAAGNGQALWDYCTRATDRWVTGP